MKPVPGTVKLVYTLQWYRGIASRLTDIYPVEVVTGTEGIDHIKPWVQLTHRPTFMDGTAEMYEPFVKEPVLYLKFAKLDENNPAEIQKFVKKYGLLGIDSEVSAVGYYMESLARWRYEIREMRGMLALWDICRNEFDRKIRPYIRDRRHERVFMFTWREEWESSHIYTGEPYAIPLADTDTIPGLRKLVLNYIDGRLRDIAIGFDTDTLGFIYEPVNLLSTMWIMFLVKEILEESDIYYCDYCGDPFERHYKKNIYCKPSCKVMACRDRSLHRRPAA